MIVQTLKRITPLDEELIRKAMIRLDSLTKPVGSLGRLEECAAMVVAITGNEMPCIDRKVVFTFAGDHGVASCGVSAYPKEVTPQMVINFVRGGAAINVLARQARADVAVVDVGVDYDFGDIEGIISRKIMRGTKNMLEGPAMTRKEAIRCIEVGISLASEYKNMGYDIFGTGDMGIGNTTAASAIASVMIGIPPRDVTGRGTGITDDVLESKISVIKSALEKNRPDPTDPIDVLSKVGGAEIGAIAGLVIGGAAERVPVVVDGFISTAGALIAYGLEPGIGKYIFSAHRSAEKGHMVMLERMKLRPLLELDMRLGEGTGAALAMMIIESGLAIYREMATFDEAGVSDKDK